MFTTKASKPSLRKSGDSGEALVVEHFKKQGYQILERNYQKQYGEIDIIAQKDDVIACIEVKTRYKPLFDMTELIPFSKQKKIILVAKQYCAQNRITNQTIRFDVALVRADQSPDEQISIIENAFSEGG